MKKTLLTIALASAFTASFAMAEQPSFSYVEGGYSSFEDADGYGVRGSFALTDNFYITGAYSDLTEDNAIGSFDLDVQQMRAGIGVNTAISDNTAVYGEINYLDVELELGGLSGDDDGHAFVAGVRSMLTDSTELYGQVANVEFDETSTQLAVGARQYFTDNFGVFAEATRDDFDGNGYSVGVNFKF